MRNCIPHFISFKDWWEFFKLNLKQECIDFAKQKRTELNREKVILTNRLIRCKQLLIHGDISASAEIIALEAHLLALSNLEIEGVKTRSRARWMEEGEKPTRYFFHLEHECVEKNRVVSMYDSDGNEVSSHANLDRVHVEFYTQLFSEEAVDMTCQQHLFLQLSSKLTPEESFSCDGPISPPELTVSVKSLALNKSPGPDGLTLEFYLKFLHLLAPLLYRLYNSSFTEQSLPESLRTSVMCLIFKKRGDVKDLKN